MRFLLDLPAYLLFLCGALRVLVYPVTRGGAWPWSPTYSWYSQPLVGMTALQALTFAALGIAWLRWGRVATEANLHSLRPKLRLVLYTGLVLGVTISLALALASSHKPPTITTAPSNQESNVDAPTSSPASVPTLPTMPTLTPAPPEVPTLDEVAESLVIKSAAFVIDIWVNGAHRTFDNLDPDDKDRLCIAGKEIRASMKAHGNSSADLNHTERAIYDLTTPRGRCK